MELIIGIGVFIMGGMISILVGGALAGNNIQDSYFMPLLVSNLFLSSVITVCTYYIINTIKSSKSSNKTDIDTEN